MKKKLHTIVKRKKTTDSERITNKTVAEHREKILASGRKFKYPIQYPKHRLVYMALSIGFVTVCLFTIFSWWQLYRAQTTSSFFYRVTKIIPLPVAEVDGEWVSYGDYLMNYKVSETYFRNVEKIDRSTQLNDGGSTGSQQLDFHKALAMQETVADTYAAKIAQEKNLVVTDAEIDEKITQMRQVNKEQISQEVYEQSLEQSLGLNPQENREYLHSKMLRQKVEFAIDDEASNKVAIAKKLIAENKQDFKKVQEKMKEQGYEVQILTSGWVPKTNQDGGKALAASKLKKGQVSDVIRVPSQSQNEYVFVKLLSQNKNGEINYQSLTIPLTMFERELLTLDEQGKIKYYISLPDTEVKRNDKE